MRRLVNNWLFGEVSPRMTGRLDTDVYGNSCHELTNMHVFRQGGISRRPCLVNLLETSGYTRIISGKGTADEPCAFLLGAGKLGYMDFNENEIESIQLPLEWQTISAEQVKDVRFARYYNDFYFVHGSFPLMRVQKIVGHVAGLPHLFVNQDIGRKYIELTITVGVATAEQIVFTFNGKSYNINVSVGDSSSDVAETIASLTISGWDVDAVGNVVNFKAEDIVDSYRAYDSSVISFKKKNSELPPSSFSWEFALKAEDENERSGLVYGEDDFLDCWLNQTDPTGQKHYASDISIIGERMWLLVNSDVPQVYVSRPYRTSQIVYPKDSNDTILDFIQFELVATTSTQMKEEDYLPIKVGKDADGNTMWEGVSNDQRIWIPPAENQIKTRKDLDAYRADYEFELEYDPQHMNIVTKLTCGDTVINYQNCWYLTYDDEPDTNKLVFDSASGRHYSDIYSSSNETAVRIWVVEPNATSAGLEYEYFKTEDIRPATRTRYYSKEGSSYVYVANPTTSDMPNLYERRVVFTDIDPTSQTFIPVYENGKQYILNGTQLRMKSTYNSMIYTLSSVEVVSGELVETVVCTAIPMYVFDTTMTSEMYEEKTELDKVATASTALQFALSTGRNDKLRWIALGDSIMIGTESTEWRLPPDMNALDGSASIYSSFGTSANLTANINTDLVYVQHGNLLRMFYTDDYGLQTLEISSINPEIMQGEITDIVSMPSPEPVVDILIDGDIIHLCVDRTNGVQAFSRWTFHDDVLSICTFENHSGSALVALMTSDDGDYLAIFDDTWTVDCGYTYFKTSDTTPKQGTTYYELEDGEYVVVSTVPDNPKSAGLYEFGLRNDVYQYISRMTANPFDSMMEDGSVTLGEYKNVSKIVFRCLDTGRIRTYYTQKDKQVTRTPICCNRDGTYVGGLCDHTINVNGGSVKDLMITVESVDDEPLTLLAMAYELRINRNGAT